jgi:hypothetical protein
MTPLATRFWFLVLLISVVLPVVGASPARGDIIAQYAFNPEEDNCFRVGPGYEATVSDPGVLASDVSLSDSIPDSHECYIEVTDPPYDTRVLRLEPGPDSSSADQAVENDKYFQFTVMAAPDSFLDLVSLTFEAARGGADMPRGWVLRSSVDNFASNIDTQFVETQRPELTLFTIDLSDGQFQGLSAVTFRIYTFVPFDGQSVDYRNVTLNGSVGPVSR